MIASQDTHSPEIGSLMFLQVFECGGARRPLTIHWLDILAA